MATVKQVIGGLGDYIQRSIMPRMDSKRKFITGVAYIMASSKIEQVIPELANLPAVKVLGVVDESGNIDIESLYSAAKAQIEKQDALALDIPFLGEFTFHANDIDELYRYILNNNTPS